MDSRYLDRGQVTAIDDVGDGNIWKGVATGPTPISHFAGRPPSSMCGVQGRASQHGRIYAGYRIQCTAASVADKFGGCSGRQD